MSEMRTVGITPCAWWVRADDKMPVGNCPKIRRMQQTDGDDKYSVTWNGRCLNKDGKWEYEPQPSSRDDDFLARCRFDSFDDAVVTLDRYVQGR